MIVLLCGPPGVGKTTVATGVAERLADRGSPIRVIHSDDFARNTYERMYERVAENGRDWLLDGTFCEREWRERFRGLDELRVVYLTADLETCLERNRKREDPISETGVHAIYWEFELPRADLTVETDELAATAAIARVVQAIERWR